MISDKILKIAENTHLTGCRDSLRKSWNLFISKGRTIGICRLLNFDLNKTNKFLEMVETKIGIPKNKQTEIYKTNYQKAIIFKANPFWLRDDTSRSLFTLIVRCATSYYQDGDTISAAIIRYPLAKDVHDAVMFYLDGNNTPTYPSLAYNRADIVPGFVTEFKGKCKNEIESKLTCPPEC